jgi:hypothetical protein
MVIAHQVLMWNERLIACNNNTEHARAMDTWPVGRTLVYGIAFTDGPRIVQQPLFIVPRNVASNIVHAGPPDMEELRPNPTYRPPSNPPSTEPLENEDEGAQKVESKVAEPALDERSEHVRDLIKKGRTPGQIVREIWNVEGGTPYQKAMQELSGILAKLV